MIIRPQPPKVAHYRLDAPKRFDVAPKLEKMLSGSAKAMPSADGATVSKAEAAAIARWAALPTRWIGFYVSHQILDAAVAARMGVGPVNASSSAKSTSLVYSAMFHTDEYQEETYTEGIYARRSCIGIRLELTVSDIKASFGLSAVAVALAVEAGLARAQYKLKQPGMSNRPLTVRSGNTFSSSSLADVGIEVQAAFQWALANPDLIQAEPVLEYLGPSAPEGDPLRNAQAMLFAAKCISRGLSFAEASEESAGVDRAVLRSAYRFFTFSIEQDQKPTEADAKRAEAWIRGTA